MVVIAVVSNPLSPMTLVVSPERLYLPFLNDVRVGRVLRITLVCILMIWYSLPAIGRDTLRTTQPAAYSYITVSDSWRNVITQGQLTEQGALTSGEPAIVDWSRQTSSKNSH